MPDWDAINWQLHEGNVKRLRQRIFKAAREQDWAEGARMARMGTATWACRSLLWHDGQLAAVLSFTVSQRRQMLTVGMAPVPWALTRFARRWGRVLNACCHLSSREQIADHGRHYDARQRREVTRPGALPHRAPVRRSSALAPHAPVPDEEKSVTEEEQLAAEFEIHRPYLHAIAFRVLGSHADADDAVQEGVSRDAIPPGVRC